jgi:pimeloyl-ACP methyl ester carboxylesterase
VPIAQLDSFSVYYEEYGAGDAIVLCSGIGADHQAWKLQTAFLRNHMRVIVFDNPGVGHTTGLVGPYTAVLFADVLADLLSYLDVANAHVVGASMGGIVAQELALRHPTLVRSLQLHCTWARADRYLVSLFQSWECYAQLVSPLDLARQIWLWVFTPNWYNDRFERLADLEREVRENPLPQSPRAFCDQAAACRGHDAFDRLAGIEAPTLVTVGDRDLLAPAYHSMAIKSRMPAAMLHVWPNMGHAAFWEIPDDFNELCLTFAKAH